MRSYIRTFLDNPPPRAVETIEFTLLPALTFEDVENHLDALRVEMFRSMGLMLDETKPAK